MLLFQLAQKQPPSQKQEYAGISAIFIELEGKPQEAQYYISEYSKLIERLSAILKKEYSVPQKNEYLFMSAFYEAMAKAGLQIADMDGLHNSLKTNLWDCDSSSILALDTAKKFALQLTLVSALHSESAKEHVFAQGETYFLDLPNRRSEPILNEEIQKYYSKTTGRADTPEKIDALAHVYKGIEYAGEKKYPDAIRHYKKAIALNFDSATAYSNLGSIYHGLGDYMGAIKCHSEAIKLNNQDPHMFYNRGISYYSLKEYAKAIRDYDEALRLYPNDTDFFNNRGIATACLYGCEAAIPYFKKALAIDPNNAGARANLKQAEEEIKKAKAK